MQTPCESAFASAEDRGLRGFASADASSLEHRGALRVWQRVHLVKTYLSLPAVYSLFGKTLSSSSQKAFSGSDSVGENGEYRAG